MGYKCFEIEEADGIAHVRLSRGEQLNTMIPEFWSELPAIVDEISDAGRARVIVLSSTGRHSCAGMDLSVLSGESALNYSRDHTVEESLRHIALWQSGMFHPTDLVESFQAQTEERPPAYDDLPEVRRGL